MTRSKPRISKTGVTSPGLKSFYSNSIELLDLDPSLVRIIPGNSLSSVFLATREIQADSISGEQVDTVDGSETSKADSSSSSKRGVPSLGDISIVSNTVVYDAAGLPSVTLIFKVKNSSGETLRGMNAKVELI